MSASAAPAEGSFGDLMRYWRRTRALSQLDLASAAATTPRHLSFLETGRSRPTREMVVRLADALEIPLRDRNGLLLAAGFAPLYPLRALDDPQLERITAAVGAMLDHHEPLPAVVLDRGWAIQRANGGAQRLFGSLFAPAPIPIDANVLRLMLEPGPVRDAVANWADVVPGLLERARREAVGGVLDLATADLVDELRARPDVAAALAATRVVAPSGPVIDIAFLLDDVELRFFSVISTIGTPIDVTAQELRVECFFPADAETADRWAEHR